MAVNLGIPTDISEFKIIDFHSAVNKITNRIFPNSNIKSEWELIKSENLYVKDLIVKETTTLHFPNVDAEINIHFDELVTSYSYNGEDFSSMSFSMDISGFRSPMGYLMLSILSVLIAERTKHLIEDPVNYWVQSELLSVSDFIKQIRIIDTPIDCSLTSLSEIFYSNLHRSGLN